MTGLDDNGAAVGDGEAPAATGAVEHANSGHRKRLRSRFLDSGDDALSDHELLEVLLFGAIPRRDVKPLAKALIKRFGTLGGVLNAEAGQLERSAGLSRTQAAQVKIVAACTRRMLREDYQGKPILSNWQAVINYLALSMQYLETEEFRVIYLNKKLRVILDECQQKGTVDHAPVYPREVARRSLELNASSVLLVHNHPSGDPKPSTADIEMTRVVARALKTVEVHLHDHVIIARNGYNSLKAMGLI
ncbi:DNA repair protein RadC [Fodinicurvata sp. EGI_FJ10296]|uniref:RadC family protein n=1 Tax=Fodinicurvata sp. EGI_FJ10296 TaxID=3231908 RepID=UPI003452EE4D